MGTLTLNTSKARKDFKQLIGQTNHFLITILVGLDGVYSGNTVLSPDFSTSWNPKNKQTSAIRSRHFAIKATLAWCVDALDGYFVMSCQEPSIVQNPVLIHTTLNEMSIFRKFKAFNKEYNSIRSSTAVEIAMIELAITWRNRLIHYNSDNVISQSTRDLLIRNRTRIQSDYQGLDINDLLSNYDGYKNPPRFKEVTALIRAIHKYVEILDKEIIRRLNFQAYAESVVKQYLNNSNKDDRINNIWSKDQETTIKKLKNVLVNNGFEEENTVNSRNLLIDNNNPLVILGAKGAKQLFV
jgi:hypothetical protein